MEQYLIYIMQSVIVLLLAPLFSGILKNIKNSIRGFKGTPLIQPYYNIGKLLKKGRVISKSSSFITQIGPLLCIAACVTIAFMLPIFYTAPINYIGSIFIVIFTMSIIKLMTTLMGLDCASTFGGMGSSRELFISMLAEPTMFVAIAFLFIETRSFNIYSMAYANSGVFEYSIAHIMASMSFLIILIAENARMPVDNPETHLELTMIHEAMILDISGPDLAFVELSSSIKLTLFLTVFINGFYPIGIGTSINAAALFIGFVAYIAKLLACLGFIALVEATMAKFRLFRAPELLAAAFSMSIVAIAINYFA